MPNPVNLRQARKRKERLEKERAAAANRVRHGTSRAERDANAAARLLEEKRLDGSRRDHAKAEDSDQPA